MIRLLRALPIVLVACLTWAGAGAEDYPNRPVKIIVPFGAGGPADLYARVLAQHLSDTLKQSFIVEDRPGAGSVIGTDAVAKSPPDGYTLLAMSNTHTTNESLLPNKPFQLMRDFVPVTPINSSDLVMVVHPSVPANNLQEFIALAKAKPGELNYASSGPGTPYHMAGELFKAMSGTDIVHVPHKGSGEARNSVLGGHVQMMFDAVPTMAENIKSGQVRALGVSGTKRSAVLPEVPTIAEAGVPGYEFNDLAWPDGADRHAQADRRQAQHRDRRHHAPPRRGAVLGRAGRRADLHDPGGVSGLPAQGHREVGQRGEDLRREGGVGRPQGPRPDSSRRWEVNTGVGWVSRLLLRARCSSFSARCPRGPSVRDQSSPL